MWGAEVGHLTGREIEVLQLAAEGLTDSAIAQRIGITERTVLHHVSKAKEKLESRTRPQAIATAIRQGLID